MKLRFTKMQGLGNDFIVIDATRGPLEFTRAQWRALADRHFGIGADQILIVEAARRADTDFRYRIFNADGGEVEQCGNGARCFVRFVRDRGLSTKDRIRVETLGGIIEPRMELGGAVSVDMGIPSFAPASLPFDPAQHLADTDAGRGRHASQYGHAPDRAPERRAARQDLAEATRDRVGHGAGARAHPHPGRGHTQTHRERPQRFGTQYRSDSGGKMKMYVTSDGVTDAMRAALHVPTLSEAKEREQQMQAMIDELGKTMQAPKAEHPAN